MYAVMYSIIPGIFMYIGGGLFSEKCQNWRKYCTLECSINRFLCYNSFKTQYILTKWMLWTVKYNTFTKGTLLAENNYIRLLKKSIPRKRVPPLFQCMFLCVNNSYSYCYNRPKFCPHVFYYVLQNVDDFY